MPDCVTDQTAEHGSDAVGAVVDLETERLLGGGVPHAHDEYESGVYGRFEGAEEEAVGGYAGEGGACWGCDEAGDTLISANAL